MGNKELLNKYIKLMKEHDELANESGIMIMNGLVGNEKWKQLEKNYNHVNSSMNSVAKRFIESFLLE
jgi:hypothetical protein